MNESELRWMLLYTKPHAESWAEINLRRQLFATLLPRVRHQAGFRPLFPRYLFVGLAPEQTVAPLRSTRGILYIVHCGERPAHVPSSVILEVRARMDARGVVAVDPGPGTDPLFASRERERIRTLEKLARAGFRVVA
jgi:transcriptional antiterminator RfaH